MKDKHKGVEIHLGHVTQIMNDDRTRNNLVKWLESIDATKRCKVCGGIPINLILVTDSKETILQGDEEVKTWGGLKKYIFCLWKVEEDGEVVAETDYKRFADYLGLEMKRSERDEH